MAKDDEKKRPGRIDDSQEQVIKIESLNTRIKHLVGLHNKAADASKDLAEGIKKVAEESGLLAATVRKFIAAKASEDFDEAKRKVVQLALVFEEANAITLGLAAGLMRHETIEQITDGLIDAAIATKEGKS